MTHGTTRRRSRSRSMNGLDDTEIDWHRRQITDNRSLIEELEAGNTAGGDVFPETQAEIDRLKAQLQQSELIVASYEKQPSQG